MKKYLLFVKFEIILPLLCFFLEPLYKHCSKNKKHMEFFYKFVDRLVDIKSKDSYCQQGKGLAIT